MPDVSSSVTFAADNPASSSSRRGGGRRGDHGGNNYPPSSSSGSGGQQSTAAVTIIHEADGESSAFGGGGGENGGDADANFFQIRPRFEHKFRPGQAKALMHKTLESILSGQVYDFQKVSRLSKMVSDAIKNEIKSILHSRYKLVVQVFMGEEKGSGLRIGARCLWDGDTDNYACETFFNDSLFCAVAVFAIYYY